MLIENCDLTATKLFRKRSLRRQQHLKLLQATFEKSRAASNFIDESVQNSSDSDEESGDFLFPEFVFKSHKCKSSEAVIESPQNPKRPH